MIQQFFKKSLVAIPIIMFTSLNVSSQTPSYEPSEECKTFMSKTLASNNWVGDFVTVPQDWSKPHSSPKIKVFFYYDNSRSLTESNPIFFLNGGPFTSYHNRMEALQKKIQKYDINKNHLFIMMDQRGTGCSVPLMPKGDESIETYRKYSSENIIKDSEVIRRKLFRKKKWKLFAQSYGGFLAARYLHLYPKNISEVHVYGPALHESMTDFFMFRILKQNEMLPKFLEYYKNAGVDLQPAFEIFRSAEKSKKYCLPATAVTVELCGMVLLDAVTNVIGQGYGRDEGTTEIWDGVRNDLLNVIAADNEELSEEERGKALQAFKTKANGSLGFFRNPSAMMVSTIWSQEMSYINGNNSYDCEAAYKKLEEIYHMDIAQLPIDECRIIRLAQVPAYKEKLQNGYKVGESLLRQDIILADMKKNPQIPFYLYTGEMDTLAQIEALSNFKQSSYLHYIQFPKSGHAGWLYEPLLWKNLMDK